MFCGVCSRSKLIRKPQAKDFLPLSNPTKQHYSKSNMLILTSSDGLLIKWKWRSCCPDLAATLVWSIAASLFCPVNIFNNHFTCASNNPTDDQWSFFSCMWVLHELLDCLSFPWKKLLAKVIFNEPVKEIVIKMLLHNSHRTSLVGHSVDPLLHLQLSSLFKLLKVPHFTS